MILTSEAGARRVTCRELAAEFARWRHCGETLVWPTVASADTVRSHVTQPPDEPSNISAFGAHKNYVL